VNPPLDLGSAPPEAFPNEFLGSLDPEFPSRFESYSSLNPRSPSSLETRGLTAQIQPSNGGYRSAGTAQLNFLFAATTLKDQISHRILSEVPDHPIGKKLGGCHTRQTGACCKSCDRTKFFWNRCDLRFCPLCARRLSRERKQQFQFWVNKIDRPKFLTLTIKNTPSLQGGIVIVKSAWKSLRRSVLFRNVRSGLWSLEVTNQGRGWHVHLHALLDSGYLPQEAIEVAWSKRVGQLKSIVDIRQKTGEAATREALKYCCKPEELAKWPIPLLLEYVDQTEGLRMFGVFGQLHSQRSEWTEFVKDLRAESSKCECGCNAWRLLDPPDPECKFPVLTRPNPPPNSQLSLKIHVPPPTNYDRGH